MVLEFSFRFEFVLGIIGLYNVFLSTVSSSSAEDGHIWCLMKENNSWPQECNSMGDYGNDSIEVGRYVNGQSQFYLAFHLPSLTNEQPPEVYKQELDLNEEKCSCTCQCQDHCTPLNRLKFTGIHYSGFEHLSSGGIKPSCFQLVASTSNGTLSSCCIYFPGREEEQVQPVKTTSHSPQNATAPGSGQSTPESVMWICAAGGLLILCMSAVACGILYRRQVSDTAEYSLPFVSTGTTPSINKVPRRKSLLIMPMSRSKSCEFCAGILEKILKNIMALNVYSVTNSSAEICEEGPENWLPGVLDKCETVIVVHSNVASTAVTNPFSDMDKILFLHLRSYQMRNSSKFVHVSLENVTCEAVNTLNGSHLFVLPAKLEDFVKHIALEMDEEKLDECKKLFRKYQSSPDT